MSTRVGEELGERTACSVYVVPASLTSPLHQTPLLLSQSNPSLALHQTPPLLLSQHGRLASTCIQAPLLLLSIHNHERSEREDGRSEREDDEDERSERRLRWSACLRHCCVCNNLQRPPRTRERDGWSESSLIQASHVSGVTRFLRVRAFVVVLLRQNNPEKPSPLSPL